MSLPIRSLTLFIAVVSLLLVANLSLARPADTIGERGPSIRTVACPLLTLDDVLAGPCVVETHAVAAQRSIGRSAGSEALERTGRVGASSGKAVLLNAIAPGAGHIYSGYNRGYLYLGVEAAAWISFFVLREDGSRKEDQSEKFAGDPFHGGAWSFERYESEGFCGAPGGAAADSVLRHSWTHDRQTFYDLIDSDISYRCGWDPGTWLEYRDMRDKSDELMRWARYAGAAVILNHVVSVLDVFRLNRSMNFQVPGGANVKFTVKPDLPHPTGRIQIKKAF